MSDADPDFDVLRSTAERIATGYPTVEPETDRRALAEIVLHLIGRIEHRDEILGRVSAARAEHPECTETEFTCGWKRTVQDIDQALGDYT